jgi:AraC-like DNA-binding protein
MPIIRDIVLGAEKRKANLTLMCSELGINPNDLHNSEIQVPFEKAYRAWEIAVEQTGDKFLGLRLGEQTNPSILGLVGHLMQSCRNLEDAFKNVVGFSSVATDMFAYKMEVKKNLTVLSFEPCSPWIKLSPNSARQATEQAMAGTINVFQILSGKKIYPVQVSFKSKKPKEIEEYEIIFQSIIKWNADSNALIFETRQLQIPVLSYDQSLTGLFNKLIQQRLTDLKNSNNIEHKIKKEILTTFRGQLPGIESMASRFNMTSRSLQRKLEEIDSSYRKIIGNVGKELSISLLKNDEIKTTEIAHTLGYSDVRAFQRAFKMWTGRYPK